MQSHSASLWIRSSQEIHSELVPTRTDRIAAEGTTVVWVSPVAATAAASQPRNVAPRHAPSPAGYAAMNLLCRKARTVAPTRIGASLDRFVSSAHEIIHYTQANTVATSRKAAAWLNFCHQDTRSLPFHFTLGLSMFWHPLCPPAWDRSHPRLRHSLSPLRQHHPPFLEEEEEHPLSYSLRRLPKVASTINTSQQRGRFITSSGTRPKSKRHLLPLLLLPLRLALSYPAMQRTPRQQLLNSVLWKRP